MIVLLSGHPLVQDSLSRRQAGGEEDDKRLAEAAIVTAMWMSLSRVKTISLYELLGRVVVCSRLQLISLGLSSTHDEKHDPLQS